MKQVNTQISRLTANPIGAIAGAAAGYYTAKNLVKTDKTWMLVGMVIVAAVVGASVQASMSKKGAPTAAVVAGK